MTVDLVVIGAGPAGLAAAAEARRAGLAVVVLDEQSAPGGQIYRQVERIVDREPERAARLGTDYLKGAALVAEFRGSGADYRPGALVWHVEPGRAWYVKGDVAEKVNARRILLATGAIERPMALPGWTLPGVNSAGGAQILLKTSGLLPAADAVLMGSGPLLFLLLQQVLEAGGRVQALVETVSPLRYLTAAPHLLAATRAGYLGKGIAMLRALGRSGTHVYRGACALAIEGTNRAECVTFQHRGRSVRLDTNTVILHEGVIPNQQFTRLANCAHHWDSAQRCFVPKHDEWGNSSVEGVMVAGDGAGIGGAVVAAAAGRIAALEAARALGFINKRDRDERSASWRALFALHARGRRFLEVMYAPSNPVPSADDVIVCRCEEVTGGQVRQAAAAPGMGANQVKSLLRCGMGPCQGRMCGPTVSAIIAAERGIPEDEAGYFRIRPPLKPIPLKALVEARVEEGEPS